MTRFLVGLLMFALTGAFASCQQEGSAAASQNKPESSISPELLSLIATQEAVLRNSKSLRLDDSRIAATYEYLGNLYANAGMYLKAEDAMHRAIAILKKGDQSELALEYGQLGVLHVQMEDPGQAEHDEMHSLQIREAVGDPVGTALTWNDLAGLYDQEHKFKQAAEYGQRAYELLADRPNVDLGARISVRESLGYALTALRSCDKGLSILNDALALAKTAYGVGNPMLGYPEYVLGFGYWHCGDRTHAAEWLEQGTTHMQAVTGWDHNLYVNGMKQYARFLREDGQVEAATNVETVVNQAEAVVDARTLTSPAKGFRSSGSK